jgi:hypothetical protein
VKAIARDCACGRPISANKLACRACLDATVSRSAAAPTFSGVLEILNVQGGDVKITFDKDNPQESIRAKRIVSDMLRRGYALVVEVERDGDRKYERAQGFDEKTGEYIIADFDPVAAQEADTEEVAGTPPSASEPMQATLKKRGRTTKRLPMETTKATGIGRSAGG